MLSTPNAGPIFDADYLRNHPGFFALVRRTANRLHIVGCGERIEAITPDIRAQFSKSESGVVSNDAFAQRGTRLALANRAVAEIVHLCAHRLCEFLSLGRLGDKEVVTQVHVYTKVICAYLGILDHSGLYVQTFLGVYQNGTKLYAGAV